MRTFFIICGLFVITACNNKAKREDNKTPDTIPVVIETPPVPLNDTVFTGFGTEPFWAVYVIKNNKIVFHPADGPDVEVPWVEAIKPDAVTKQYSASGNGNSIDLGIVKKDCSDGMSDETHPYEVTLSVNKIKYSGCGRKEK